MAVEAVVIVAAWAIQIAAVLFPAFIVALAGEAVEEIIRKRKVKLFPRVLVVFLLLCAVLAAFAVNPPVICGGEFGNQMTDVVRDRVRDGADGLYSWKLPLVPLCVELTGIENCVIDGKKEQKAEFSVYYFCLGKRRMEYSTYDGYNAYPMFGLQ